MHIPKTLIYCGVNRGYSLYKKVHDFDLIIGFEPNPDAFNFASSAFSSFKHVKLFPVALSDKEGIIDFHIYENDAVGSIQKITSEWQEAHPNEKQTFVKTIPVQSIHLGNFIDKLSLAKVDTLITDLQGMDLTILKTVSKHIQNGFFETIICEVELDNVPLSYEKLHNKELGFDQLLEPYYTKTGRAGESDWFTNDILWKRTS